MRSRSFRRRVRRNEPLSGRIGQLCAAIESYSACNLREEGGTPFSLTRSVMPLLSIFGFGYSYESLTEFRHRKGTESNAISFVPAACTSERTPLRQDRATLRSNRVLFCLQPQRGRWYTFFSDAERHAPPIYLWIRLFLCMKIGRVWKSDHSIDKSPQIQYNEPVSIKTEANLC